MTQNINQIERELEQMIDSVNQQLGQARNLINQHTNIVLLVGTTGSGKSTIYNWVLDAEFSLNVDDDINPLNAQHAVKQIAVMNGQGNSVTKKIQLDYNQNLNMITIDFPGFQDTSGAENDLQTDLVLYKLSQNKQIKIIYVLTQQGDRIVNRATLLQEFINQNSLDQSQISIILNGYNGQKGDQELKDHFIRQIKQCDCFREKFPNNIFTLRQIDDEETLKNQLVEKKQAFIDFLKNSAKINLQVKKLSNTEIISKYIQEKKNWIVTSYQKIMNQLEQIINGQNNQVIIEEKNFEIQQLITNFMGNLNNNQLDFIQSFDLILQTIQDIYNLLGISQEISFTMEDQQQYEKFKRIFQFYLQFQDQISSYKDCEQQIDLIFKQRMIRIQQQIQYIERRKQQENEIRIQYQQAEIERLNKVIKDEDERIRNQDQGSFIAGAALGAVGVAVGAVAVFVGAAIEFPVGLALAAVHALS